MTQASWVTSNHPCWKSRATLLKSIFDGQSPRLIVSIWPENDCRCRLPHRRCLVFAHQLSTAWVTNTVLATRGDWCLSFICAQCCGTMAAINRGSAGNLGPSPAGTSCSKSLRGDGVTVTSWPCPERETHTQTFSYLVISACPTLALNERKAATRADTQRPIHQ